MLNRGRKGVEWKKIKYMQKRMKEDGNENFRVVVKKVILLKQGKTRGVEEEKWGRKEGTGSYEKRNATIFSTSNIRKTSIAKIYETKRMVVARFSVRNMMKVLVTSISREEINDEVVDKKKND